VLYFFFCDERLKFFFCFGFLDECCCEVRWTLVTDEVLLLFLLESSVVV